MTEATQLWDGVDHINTYSAIELAIFERMILARSRPLSKSNQAAALQDLGRDQASQMLRLDFAAKTAQRKQSGLSLVPSTISPRHRRRGATGDGWRKAAPSIRH